MKIHVYMVFDNVSQKTVAYFDAPSVGIVIRNNYKYFEKVNPYYQQDWIIYEVGEIGDNGLPDYYTRPYVTHNWSEYNFPEQEAVPMTSLEKAKLQNQPSGISGTVPSKL